MVTAYITAPPTVADSIAETLVEERLAACVNVVPCRSVYRWAGAVEHASEAVLVAKTTDAGYGRLVERVDELHPYEVPCIERFEETDALPGFLWWRDDAVDGVDADAPE